jgi:hypothetical protein
VSSKPSQEGAAKVIRLLAHIDTLGAEIVDLRRAAQRLKEAEHDYGATQRELWKALESMDCASSGNTGFEGRMGWLLGEMWRQLTAKETR